MKIAHMQYTLNGGIGLLMPLPRLVFCGSLSEKSCIPLAGVGRPDPYYLAVNSNFAAVAD